MNEFNKCELRLPNSVTLVHKMYEGESNENFKSAIKIRNTARLSCNLTTMILMV